MKKKKEPERSSPAAQPIKGWAAIAKFLGQHVSTVQRWATEGMLTRIGRYVAAYPAELEDWLSREAGAKGTVHIASAGTDLLPDLKRGLSEARKTHPKSR